jgi:YD repeat-containing protein
VRFYQLLCLASALMSLPSFVEAQCNKGGIRRSSLISNSGEAVIDFALDHPVSYTDTDQTVIWLLYDQDGHRQVQIKSIHYDASPHSSSGLITIREQLNASGTYILSAAGLKFENCSQTVQTNYVRVNTSAPKKTGVTSFPVSAAPSRDSADIYLSGLISGAQHSHAAYTADVKTQLPVILPDAWFVGKDPSGKPRYGPAEVAFIPSFDFKASTNSKSNSNAIVIGSGLRFTVPLTNGSPVSTGGQPSASFFRDWVPYVGYALESDKQFTDVNNTLTIQNYFNVRTFGTQLQLVLRPMLGVEVGSNARAPQPNLYGGAILRPTVGLHAFLNLFTSKDFKKTASVESDYVERWPMYAEPNSITNSAGKVQVTSVGTNPRGYVTAKLTYNFDSYFGLTLQYDNGRLPPLFTKVQNAYSVGLVFKMGLQYKPK